MRIFLMAVMVALVGMVVGCERSGSGTTTAPSGDVQQKLKEDLRQVGEDLKAVKDEAATRVGPAWEKAKDEGRQAVHDVAQKVANETAGPATTMPQ